MAKATADDISFEEDILRDPYNLKNWWYYLEYKAEAPEEVRNLIYERAVRSLPRSYKMWFRYLNERMSQCKDLAVTDVVFRKVNQCFERALVHMHKFPRVWKEYLSFLMKQKRVTLTRRTFDRALRALPITQHMQWIWPLYTQFIRSSGVPAETAIRVYRRYLLIEPKEVENYVKFLKKSGKLDEAALQLAKVVNDDKFVSQHGKSKHDLWTELLTLVTKNPKEVTSLNVEAIIRSGIRRFAHETGRLWNALADYYIRLGHFEKARDVYEEGINTVATVRDFTQMFDAYSQFEEASLAAKMENIGQTEDEEEAEAEQIDIDLRIMRLESLMNRRPLLLSSVLLRQNPHNVREWHKRVELFTDPAKIIQTYTDAVTTVDPQQATAKPHSLWIAFARFYEKYGDLLNARVIFEKATQVNYKQVDDLATLWCEYAEMELRQGQHELALEVLKKACVVPHEKYRQFRKGGAEKLHVSKRVYKSTKLWCFYADLEESLGTLQSCKAVYETMFDIKIITPHIVITYAQLMEEHKYFEDSFRVYEKGIATFTHPHVFPIWLSYLQKFISRFKGTKVERTRDMFEQAVEGCPAKEGKSLYLLYAKFEEDYGMTRRAMNVYARACEAAAQTDKLEMYLIYIQRCAEYFGVTQTREIYEKAIEKLGDRDLGTLSLKYAAMERRLGEIDRARAIYGYASQFCDPRVVTHFWKTWHDFEVHHGNEDTFREMLRVRRSVQIKYGALVKQPAAKRAAPAGGEEQGGKRAKTEAANPLEALEAQQEAATAEKAEKAAAKSEEKTQAQLEAMAAQGDANEIRMSDDEEPEIAVKKVPDAVFGAAAGAQANATGAKARFANKK